MSGFVLTGAVVGSIWLCADIEGIEYGVGEYSKFMSATDGKPGL